MRGNRVYLARRDSTIVTGCATTVNPLVIKCAAFKGCSGMTVGAIFRSALVN